MRLVYFCFFNKIYLRLYFVRQTVEQSIWFKTSKMLDNLLEKSWKKKQKAYIFRGDIMINIISKHITNLIFVKKIFIFLFVKVLVVLNLSCQKSVIEKSVNPIDAIDSIPITFNIPEGVHISADTSSDVLLDHTADIFLFAEGLIELGRLSDKEFFTELGHRVMFKFYEDENNYTSYSFCDGSSNYNEACDENEFYNNDIPYLGVAVGIKDIVKYNLNYLEEEHKLPSYGSHDHPDCDPKKHGESCDPTKHTIAETISGLYSSSMNEIKDYIEGSQLFESRNLESIDTSLAGVNPGSDPNPTLILERCFEAVKGFLEEIIISISEDDSDISQEVRDGAVNAIQAAEVKIITLQAHLDVAIENKSSEEIVNAFELFFGIESINDITCPEDTSSTEIGIDPLCESRDLVIGLQELNNLSGTADWFGWQSWLEVIGGGDILEGLVNGVNNILPKVPSMIKDMVISEIEKTIDPDNIYNTIYSEARRLAQQKIFKDRVTLPGVELSNVKMERSVGDIISFSVDEDSQITTDGLTLGTAMSALMERLKQMETYEKSTYDVSRNYQLLFSLFNKSLSIVGHYQFINRSGDGKTYEEVIPISFFRPFRIAVNQTKEDSVNPYNYYGDEDDGKTQAGYFAIPERLILESERAFAVDLEATQQGGDMFSTVVSQAEMIRGASKVLSYLRPDRLSDYDGTMGLLNLSSDTASDIDQEEGDVSTTNGINQSLFPKPSFFNLHLGIAGIVLTNLIRDGILIHTLEGESIFGNKFEDGQEGVTPLLVSVYNVREGNDTLDNEVKTVDIARLMIAVEEFMLATEDIDKINTPNLSEFSRKSYETVSDGINKLREVNLGFHFSMMLELQREDGCFVDARNIVESHKAKSNGVQYDDQDDGKILLDTQIQALLALTRFYKRSMEDVQPDGPQGGKLKRSILKGFNCITEKLVDSQNNFYVVEEGMDQRPSLRLTTDFLKLLYELDFVISGHDDWMERLNDLRIRWIDSYIEQLGPLTSSFSFTFDIDKYVLSS